MPYRNELSFLCDIFQKNHVQTTMAEPKELLQAISPYTAEYAVGGASMSIEMPEELRHRVLYRLTDRYDCAYRLLLLPGSSPISTLCVGPFLPSSINDQICLEIGERNRLSPQKQRYLPEYYAGLPVMAEGSQLSGVLDTFCERIWGTPSFEVQDVSLKTLPGQPLFSRSMQNATPEDTMARMRAMERRYAFENDMIRAVTLGLSHMDLRFESAFSDHFFEKRVSDPLRNAKNYGVIMNTLLRKAAEQGGVHPLYLDQISSVFAVRIEEMTSLSDNASLMLEMFRAYCRLVRKHSMRNFSSVVQKLILTVDADLSADLSPGRLAASQGLSLGYLSSLFKRETGKTLTEYIRERRMEYASYLLTATNLQVQTVALHCGIMDVQYFSKMFKKYAGKTPMEHRMAHRSI